ncbi:microfibril-associated glycoprotein 4-like [Pimephales promelas]|nr:microfibril-associated glycoprotein 4-like [Pimephales promelas]
MTDQHKAQHTRFKNKTLIIICSEDSETMAMTVFVAALISVFTASVVSVPDGFEPVDCSESDVYNSGETVWDLHHLSSRRRSCLGLLSHGLRNLHENM